MTHREDAERIQNVLAGEDGQLRREGIALVFEHLLSTPVAELVEPIATRALVVNALTEENLALVIGRHVKPGYERYAKAAASAELPVGALVPDRVRLQIRDTLAATRIPRGEWTQGAVDPVLWRKLFAPVFAHLLINFAKKMPIPGMGGSTPSEPPPSGREGGGIAGRLAQSVQKRAERLVDAGKNVVGGLGAEMERRVQASVRDFSDGAVNLWRDALRDRLASEEGRALVQQISQQATDHVMVTELRAIQKDADRLPIVAILDMVPGIVAHAVPNAFIQQVITHEVDAFLGSEGKRPLGELLTELGLRDSVTALVTRQADLHARAVFASAAFSEWLSRLLAAAAPTGG